MPSGQGFGHVEVVVGAVDEDECVSKVWIHVHKVREKLKCIHLDFYRDLSIVRRDLNLQPKRNDSTNCLNERISLLPRPNLDRNDPMMT